MPRKKSGEKKELIPTKEAPSSTTTKSPATRSVDKQFPIIGIGASAGGLEALKAFFGKAQKDSGMAYIIVVHMASNQPSMLVEILQRETQIPISAIKDGEKVKPNHIYIITPGMELSIFKGKLQLLDATNRTMYTPIDTFFHSLAQDVGERAGAIILSGTGSDGTLGIHDIHSAGGVIIVQSIKSAKYDGMPRSAEGTELADRVLSPEEMPHFLSEYFSCTDALLDLKGEQEKKENTDGNWLNKIYSLLRAKLGYDFSSYKENTIKRRVSRRMGLNQIDNPRLYVRYLQENPDELKTLFGELLIGVTSFFRDPESFEHLKANALPKLLESINEGEAFRGWVAGCSSGEEIYSLAIILHELLSDSKKKITIQLFGTDLDERAIEKAREGVFHESISAHVSQERLKQFFTKDGLYYRIRREIRDTIIFSTQDMLKDPPFSNLHLLSCRNVLIYFNAEAQKKILPLFHYTLKDGGVLMLGSSESIGSFVNLFEVFDKKWKIFLKKGVPRSLQQAVVFPSGSSDVMRSGATQSISHIPANIPQITQKAILEQFSPVAVLVDNNGTILHIQGKVGKYLEPPSGPPTLNIIDQAREGLSIELASALRLAKSTKKPVVKERVALGNNGSKFLVDLCVSPQENPKELAGKFLVVFKEVNIQTMPSIPKRGTKEDSSFGDKITELEKELRLTRENHQSTTEELESSNEELKSTNEELQSSNEELQSTNEELESSKEELQSMNEEMQTINAELQSRVDELSLARDDMHNLLNNTEIATIFVNNKLHIRRFTTEATLIVNLIQSDIGRPLEHVVCNLEYDNMISDLHQVIHKLTPIDAEVQTKNGVWYAMRIMPYRTTDNKIDGAVLTFTCIDEQKKIQDKLHDLVLQQERTWELLRNIFDIHNDPMVVLNNDGEIVIANTAFVQKLAYPKEDFLNSKLSAIANGVFKKSGLQKKLDDAIANGVDFEAKSLELESNGKRHTFSISGVIIHKEDCPYRILLHFVQVG